VRRATAPQKSRMITTTMCCNNPPPSHPRRPRGSRRPRRPRRVGAGFSLVELVVTMFVLAILASIAWPSYREHVARSRRAELMAALLEDAQAMQRYYAANNGYTGTDPAPVLPVPSLPRGGGTPTVYAIAIADSTSLTYLLVATRSTGGPMADDRCGDFTLTETGTRGLRNNAAGTDVAGCWR